jgi:hypothetical protein
MPTDAQFDDRPTGDGDDGRDPGYGEARSWFMRDGSGASFGWNAHDFNLNNGRPGVQTDRKPANLSNEASTTIDR